MTRTWKVLGSVVTLAALLWGMVNVVGVLARSTQRVDVDVSAAGVRELLVDVRDSRITVVGTDEDRITVTGTIRSDIRPTRHRERRIGDRFEVWARCPGFHPVSCGADVRISVPRDLAVTVRGGDTPVSVVDVDGPVDVTTSNDGVQAVAVAGPLTVRTSNGAITAGRLRSSRVRLTTSNDRVLVRLDAPPDVVEVRTSNGRVDVVVPDTPDAYAVDVATSNGGTVTDLRTDPDSDRTISVRTSNDDVAVSTAPG